MHNFEEGSVVIVATHQAGTIVQIAGRDIWVLLKNNDIWVGQSHSIRAPQDQADLDACPVDVPRLEPKRVLVTGD